MFPSAWWPPDLHAMHALRGQAAHSRRIFDPMASSNALGVAPFAGIRRAAIPAHALIEAYATLTRMPEPFRISGHAAAEALDRAWRGRTLVPPADLAPELPHIPARASVVGGSSYDGHVALTAQAHEGTHISLDLRPSAPTVCWASSFDCSRRGATPPPPRRCRPRTRPVSRH